MNNPTFSIILPCYNVVSYLQQCLDSIFANRMEGNELILINDGSTDSFISFCNTYFSIQLKSNRNEKIYSGCNVIIINQSNHGVSYARNRGLEVATCDYCLFVDPDDTVKDNWLSNIAKSIDGQDMLLFGYDESKVDTLGNIISTQVVLPQKNYAIQTRAEAIAQLLPNYIGRSRQYIQSWARKDESFVPMEHHSVWRIAYSRRFLTKYHLRFPDKIVLNEDGIFNSNCIANASKITTLMQPLYHYHLRPCGAYSRSARQGVGLVDNKIALLHERLSILKYLEQEQFHATTDMIAGSIILSIFEMLLKAPEQYKRIKSEYILEPNVQNMIKQMPYIHKITFNVPLFILKHRCYLLLRIATLLARPVKRRLENIS